MALSSSGIARPLRVSGLVPEARGKVHKELTRKLRGEDNLTPAKDVIIAVDWTKANGRNDRPECSK